MKLYERITSVSLALAVVVAGGLLFAQEAPKEKQIYSETTDAHAEIKEALHDKAFHRADLAAIIAANYKVVHVDIGKGEKNQDLMTKYEVPMKRGIPGLAVLDPDGKLVYSQKNGEFENARAMSPDDFLAFLNKWKPAA